ncbi:MAG TPA: hypothetical protein VGJ60_36925 [Chloroflexota bacterium]|jgi:hypothetical protein
MDVFLLAPTGPGESLALSFGEKLGAPRVERWLQPDMQFHTWSILPDP